MDDLEKRFKSVSEAPIFRGDRGFRQKTSGKQMASAVGDMVSVHHYNDLDGSMTIETVQDVGAILDANKKDMTSGHDGYSPSRDLQHVATIPSSVVEQFYHQGINLMDRDHWPLVKAMLDDPEYSHFRTHKGKLSSKPHREFVTARTRGRKN